MLRHKFLLVLGSLIGLLMATAILAIAMLHDVLEDLDTLGTQAVTGTRLVLHLTSECASLQSELSRSGSGPTNVRALVGRPVEPSPAEQPLGIAARLGSLQESVQQLLRLKIVGSQPAAIEASLRVTTLIRDLPQIGSGPARPGAEPLPTAVLATLPRIQTEIAALDHAFHHGLEEERAQVVYRFRMIALGLGAVFLLVINMSVVAVSRIMSMVLKPVERLVEASRHLAREDFAHRVELDGKDEFDELGRAYNSLAAQLQSNEQRKVETMHQVARTLSHEVNNAISIIELQLALLTRASAAAQQPGDGVIRGDPAQAERLSQIRHSLSRINRTVEALTRVRRIVLTDYLAGVSMLDLERSVEDEPGKSTASVSPGVIR
jgi:HAMP domain-containing protein